MHNLKNCSIISRGDYGFHAAPDGSEVEFEFEEAVVTVSIRREDFNTEAEKVEGITPV